jgi:hypothetical protein
VREEREEIEGGEGGDGGRGKEREGEGGMEGKQEGFWVTLELQSLQNLNSHQTFPNQ